MNMIIIIISIITTVIIVVIICIIIIITTVLRAAAWCRVAVVGAGVLIFGKLVFLIFSLANPAVFQAGYLGL